MKILTKCPVCGWDKLGLHDSYGLVDGEYVHEGYVCGRCGLTVKHGAAFTPEQLAYLKIKWQERERDTLPTTDCLPLISQQLTVSLEGM